MSIASGICASPDLSLVLPKLKFDHRIRLIKIDIEDEQFVLGDVAYVQSSWENDYNSGIGNMLNTIVPCYLFIRLDYQFEDNFVLLTWIPAKADIRSKMLYATAKFEMRSIFGTSQILQDYNATNKNEANAVKFESNSSTSTIESIENEQINYLANNKKALCELTASPDILTSQGNIRIQLSSNLIENLDLFKCNTMNYICMMMDVDKEEIIVDEVRNDILNIDVFLFQPGRYHLFRETQNLKPIFVYITPSLCNFPIKTRLMCASAWASLCRQVIDMGIELFKKFEVSSGIEVSEYMNNTTSKEQDNDMSLHSLANSRPQPPGRRRLSGKYIR